MCFVQEITDSSVPSSLPAAGYVGPPQADPNSDCGCQLNKYMYTGIDGYENMEVRIGRGDAKQHFGIILASHTDGEKLLFDVCTETRTTNTVLTFVAKDLKERQ